MNANDVQVGGDHYRSKSIQPWDAMAVWMTPEQFAGFLRGNAIKYLARCDDKGGVEDLKKARHYLDKLIEVSEAKTSEAPKLPMLPMLPIEVGGTYRRRDGRVVTVDQDDGTSSPFKCSDGYWRHRDGTDHEGDSACDLVERIA